MWNWGCNRFQLKSLQGILNVRFLLAWKNQSCYSFTVDENMFKLFNYEMYDHISRDNAQEVNLCDDEVSNSETLDVVNGAFETVDSDEEIACISL